MVRLATQMRAGPHPIPLLTTFLAAGPFYAHIVVESSPFPIFELIDEDVSRIDLHDGSVEDWEGVLGMPTLTREDFWQEPTIGDGASYDPNDLEFRIWLGWHGATDRIFVAAERVDNAYINEYGGGNTSAILWHDSLEFMIDGDHSGGQYSFRDQVGFDRFRHQNAQAQQYVAIPEAPDGVLVGYFGVAAWPDARPYADWGGGVTGAEPTTSVVEFYLTPFDDLIWDDPGASVRSNLAVGKVVGLEMHLPDFDQEPRQYHAYFSLSAQTETFKYAERFVDGVLIGAEVVDPTSVPAGSWGRIKAAFPD